MTISGIDLIGIIDKTTFRGGIFADEPVPDLVDLIMTSAGAEYELDGSFSGINLSGWIPSCTHREALQQVAFAIGAVVDCSRSDKIRICPPASVSAGNIEYARKFTGQKLTLKTLVTGVEVTAHNYTESLDSVKLFDGALDAGTHEISFSEPAHTLSVTGATISESGANYAVLTVAGAGDVTLTGYKYYDGAQVFGVYASSLPANGKANVLTVPDATLISSAVGAAAAQRVYDYYQKRYENEVSVILQDEAAGEVRAVDSMYGRKILGTVEKLDIDLVGGYVADATIVGVLDTE